MRIALLSGTRTIDDGAIRGTLAYITSLAAALRDLGHEVHIFKATDSARTSSYQRVNGVDHHIIAADCRSWSSGTLTQAMIYYIGATESVAGRFDVVHAHHRALLPALDAIKPRNNASTCLTLHSDAGLSPLNGHSVDNGWNHVKTLDGVMATSKLLCDKLVDRLDIPRTIVEVAYPGVDQKKHSRWVDQRKIKEQLWIALDEPMILFVGELVRHLGPDLLLEASFEAMQRFPGLKLVFAGDGPLSPYLHERAKVLGIYPSARFLGLTSEDRIIELYNACDVVCIPARAGNVSQTVLEAWCAGKPTIVTQQVLPEFFEPFADGFVSSPDVLSLAEQLQHCVTNRDHSREIGKHVWQKVDLELSWTAIARKSERIYQNTINGRRAP